MDEHGKRYLALRNKFQIRITLCSSAIFFHRSQDCIGYPAIVGCGYCGGECDVIASPDSSYDGNGVHVLHLILHSRVNIIIYC